MRYTPESPEETPRFSGIGTFMRLPHTHDASAADVVIVGVPFDTGSTYRVGARFAPRAVRQMSALLRPFHPFWKFFVFENCRAADLGDVPVVPGYIDESYNRIQSALRPIFDSGAVPLMVGGDHSVTLPELRAAVATHGPLALVHFDSHPDTWKHYFGMPHFHGSPFARAVEEGLVDTSRSIQVGLRGSVEELYDIEGPKELGFSTITGDQLHEMGIGEAVRRIRSRVGHSKVFLSFDIDFVDPAYAPGTGTPEVGGFTSYETLKLLRALWDLNVVAYDLVEILPQYDPADITALLGANILYEFLSSVSRRISTSKLRLDGGTSAPGASPG